MTTTESYPRASDLRVNSPHCLPRKHWSEFANRNKDETAAEALGREGSTPRGLNLMVERDSLLNSPSIQKISAPERLEPQTCSQDWLGRSGVCIRAKIAQQFLRTALRFCAGWMGKCVRSSFLLPLWEKVAERGEVG